MIERGSTGLRVRRALAAALLPLTIAGCTSDGDPGADSAGEPATGTETAQYDSIIAGALQDVKESEMARFRAGCSLPKK
jgi:hypothetical protein